MITINGEKRVLGIVVGLIFIIIVILAVLISLQEKTLSKGKTAYGGNTGIVTSADQVAGNDATGNTGSRTTTPSTVRPRPNTVSVPSSSSEFDYTGDRQVIILSPFQVQESYERVRAIVYGSQCYALLGDVREISYRTGLVGTKYIADLIPNEDYSTFTVVVAVKLTDSRKVPVFYEEYPVIVDLGQNQVSECKGRPLSVDDVYANDMYYQDDRYSQNGYYPQGYGQTGYQEGYY